MKKERAFVIADDVKLVMSHQSNRSCQRYLNNLRKFLNKGKHQAITKQELADYAGVPVDSFYLPRLR
ncbi:hypothetical protein [Pedobacter metabolipauper]|uniref:Uncharacterized protein n=1 Tax=Pedobacter metabolipauper TaxID=425513 RepID=A0A4R6SX26_9SPHI|nr:hypothetical protein [Pedobacter metabolipauper]TDQ09976.1 hypothetical protein ATK78_2135 [Pedobacter metabolipauper]